jgi:hypothetical protein
MKRFVSRVSVMRRLTGDGGVTFLRGSMSGVYQRSGRAVAYFALRIAQSAGIIFLQSLRSFTIKAAPLAADLHIAGADAWQDLSLVRS